MPTIVAHRGGAGLAPENTLPAFRNALRLGVQAVELDVRLTADEVPVCFHDERLGRITPAQGRIADWQWARLREVAVQSGAFGGAYPDARIPSLEEVLAGFPGDCRVLVELKPDPARADLLVRRTLEVIGGAASRCRLISFDPELLRRVRAACPGAALGVLAGPRAAASLFPLARELGAEAVQPQSRLVDPALVQAAREAGFLVNAWTVNTADEGRRLAALGVDEITTDYPDLFL
ncbi:MAG: glycerophosphodiester phosphodiesterase [Armatimonadota bacterium]